MFPHREVWGVSVALLLLSQPFYCCTLERLISWSSLWWGENWNFQKHGPKYSHTSLSAVAFRLKFTCSECTYLKAFLLCCNLTAILSMSLLTSMCWGVQILLPVLSLHHNLKLCDGMCKLFGAVFNFTPIQKWKNRQGQQWTNLIFLLKACQLEQSFAAFLDVAMHILLWIQTSC